MKKLIVIAILAFSVVSVHGQDKKQTRKEKRAAREAQLMKQTSELLAGQVWQFDATQMIPAKGKSKSLITSYNVVVKDENVKSYLPFYGRAYSAPYGGSDSPMVFDSTIEKYSISDGKKGIKIVKFSAKNKNDNIEFAFTISPNGSASLNVNSTNRQHISYYGNLVPVNGKEKEDK